MTWEVPSRYVPLSTSDNDDTEAAACLAGTTTYVPMHTAKSRLKQYFCSFVILSSVFGLGFTFGGYITTAATFSHIRMENVPRVYVPWKLQTFQYNATFAKAPEEGNGNFEAWNSIIPKGQGFVKHPQLSPKLSAVSVVHQLHCLNDIRRAYYVFKNESTELYDAEHFAPNHMRHCFEYIRQSLLCAADSTLEPFQEEFGGVTGWQVLRKCRDYDALHEWMERWRAVELEIVSKQ